MGVQEVRWKKGDTVRAGDYISFLWKKKRKSSIWNSIFIHHRISIPAELVAAGRRTNRPEIHKLINPIWNKEEFPMEWKELVIIPMYQKGDKTDCSNYRSI